MQARYDTNGESHDSDAVNSLGVGIGAQYEYARSDTEQEDSSTAGRDEIRQAVARARQRKEFQPNSTPAVRGSVATPAQAAEASDDSDATQSLMPLFPRRLPFGDSGELHDRAKELFRAGDYAAAIPRYDRLLMIDPSDRLAANGRAASHYKLADYARARELYAEILERDPSDGDAAKYIARCDQHLATGAQRVQRPQVPSWPRSGQVAADHRAQPFQEHSSGVRYERPLGGHSGGGGLPPLSVQPPQGESPFGRSHPTKRSLTPWISAAVGVCMASVAVYGVINASRSSAAEAYQREVVATCNRVQGILGRDSNAAILSPNISAFISTVNEAKDEEDLNFDPLDMYKVNKAALVSITRGNRLEIREEFNQLYERSTPEKLRKKKAAAMTAWHSWLESADMATASLESELREGDTAKRLFHLSLQINERSSATDVRLNSALSTLAGADCRAVGAFSAFDAKQLQRA